MNMEMPIIPFVLSVKKLILDIVGQKFTFIIPDKYNYYYIVNTEGIILYSILCLLIGVVLGAQRKRK